MRQGPDQQMRVPTHPPSFGRTTAEWGDVIAAGLVALCDITELEVLCSVCSAVDRKHVRRRLNAHCIWCPIPDGIYRRARVVQELFTAKGEHRSVGFVDLPVAAAAEESGLTLLHYDRGFESIVRAAGQPVCMVDLRN